MYDYIIVGAGIAGCVMAERLSNSQNKKILIIEKRDHIGGNCYDYVNPDGIIIHKYGPHLFHTRHEDVWEYLSKFTEWHPYRHKVLGYIDGKLVPVPFNLDSLKELFPPKESALIEKKLIDAYGLESRIPVVRLKESTDADLNKIGRYVYERVFYNYTVKQWGMPPEMLDPQVISRVPIYISYNSAYFSDPHQAVPLKGYTHMFNAMLDNPLITVRLNTDYHDVLKYDAGKNIIRFEGTDFPGKLIFTGRIDEFFDYKQGELPYRSLHFDLEEHVCDFFQPAGVVNYPNDNDYTRITEFKHFCSTDKKDATVIAKEYPRAYDRKNDKSIPYYPIPREENAKQYEIYANIAEKVKDIFFIGRLAEYRYYNMDEVVKMGLELYQEL